MRMMRFQFSIVHIPGKELTIADALSHCPIKQFSESDEQLQQDSDAYVNLVLNNLPTTDKCLRQLRKAQEDDDICRMLCRFCKEG